MSNELEILYTAEATVTGGREGHGRTSDGRVSVDLDVPKEMGGGGGPGTNPSSYSQSAMPPAFSPGSFASPAGASSI
jgi:hypothetical protein